ncbi:cyclic pyranopterin monophosphate synthase MoaC [Planctomycetota bacterium]|nr:cyclic pyranopterin monophosphate synthase MoaC [Planctomycetota bacterium]
MDKSLSHIDKQGKASMVDVGSKPSTHREAVAFAEVHCSTELIEAVQQLKVKKGNLIEVARIAGIMAAKQTSNLIPLCHPLPLNNIQLDIEIINNQFHIKATVSTTAKTGVEMEALTAASVAALTIYDMGKAIDKSMIIQNIHLHKKTGGKSGSFQSGNT